MKKFLPHVMAIAMVTGLVSCGKDDNTSAPVNPPGATNTMIRGVISSNLTLTKDQTWTLRGYVYVTNGATLTIEPGTKIISKKDSAGVLVIYKGSKINAAGTSSAPIVFTSGETNPAPGDLGGVVLVGNATGNGNHGKLEGGVDAAYSAFGGTNDGDNSGVLQYVRIEYGGKAVNPDDEVNGLSLYTVGSGTTIDHIQVTRCLDDAYEFFGGTVNAKYLIAYNCADDDFDFDDGYRGNLQFLISKKDPDFTDNKTGGDFSNNIEADNTNGKIPYTTTPITHVRISNATLVGPNTATSNVIGNYGFGNRWRRGSQFELVNSIIIGSKLASFDIESAEGAAAFKSGVSIFRNNIIQSASAAGAFNLAADVGTALDLATMKSLASGVNIFTDAADAKLTDPFNAATPKLAPQTGSPALTGADFTGNFSANGFTQVSYRGALDATNDWTAGWTAFSK